MKPLGYAGLSQGRLLELQTCITTLNYHFFNKNVNTIKKIERKNNRKECALIFLKS
jgi:hypothetical protein